MDKEVKKHWDYMNSFDHRSCQKRARQNLYVLVLTSMKKQCNFMQMKCDSESLIIYQWSSHIIFVPEWSCYKLRNFRVFLNEKRHIPSRVDKLEPIYKGLYVFFLSIFKDLKHSSILYIHIYILLLDCSNGFTAYTQYQK